jgi:hypothetical protein
MFWAEKVRAWRLEKPRKGQETDWGLVWSGSEPGVGMGKHERDRWSEEGVGERDEVE